MQNQSLNEKYALVNSFLQNYFFHVFTPIQRGRRAKGVIREYKNKDKTKFLEIAMFHQLDVADQDLFLSILSMCGDGEFLEADKILDADGQIKGMHSVKIDTTAYELLKRAERQTGGKDHKWLEQSLLRLSRTSMRFESEKSGWGVNLLNYSFIKDENNNVAGIKIWVNPVAAMVFGGQKVSYIRHSLNDRLSLKNEAAKVLHSYLVGMIRQGGNRVFKIETLVERVYIDDETLSNRTIRSRKFKIKNALDCISKLKGWKVETNKQDIVKIFRAKNSK